MEEIDKIYMQRILKRLRESIVEIRKVSKDDADVARAQKEIESAMKHILRVLSKDL
jgi:flagellin-like hook-associated protein FlgL